MLEPAVYRVSAKSDPRKVAGAIAAAIQETGVCQIRAIGANAVNQTVKALAIARGYMLPNGVNLTFVPTFGKAEIGDETKTAIVFHVTPGGRGPGE